jgi:hypothetical protein
LVWLPFDFFVDVDENLVMADDVATPSNPPVAPVEKEKLEDAPLDEASFDKAPLDINVSRWSRKKKTV